MAVSFDELNRYQGYRGSNLTGFNIQILGNFKSFIKKHGYKIYKLDLDKEASKLDNMTLVQTINKVKEFVKDYVELNDINYLDPDFIPSLATSPIRGRKFYDQINEKLERIDPFELPITLKNLGYMKANLKYPLIVNPQYLDEPNRKVYFSGIEFTKKINLLAPSTLIHEIAHTQQYQLLDSTIDYLDSEIISIFLEKVVADYIDKTGKTLKVCEQIRMRNIMDLFNILESGIHLSEKEYNKYLKYVKSTLIATKLFDMYQESNILGKDKFITDINKVFNNEITVEDFVAKRNITIEDIQNPFILKKHI